MNVSRQEVTDEIPRGLGQQDLPAGARGQQSGQPVECRGEVVPISGCRRTRVQGHSHPNRADTPPILAREGPL